MHLETKLLQAATELMENYVDDKLSEKRGSKNHIESIAAYIGEHYHEPILLSQLAEHVHLNEQYLSRHFSNLMGITISDYINIQRLYHSFELLKYSDENIMDVAFKCGFASAKSYYKVCKKYLGKTPSQYRSEQKEKNRKLTSEQYRIMRHQALEKLYKYIDEEPEEKKQNQAFDIDVHVEGEKLKKAGIVYLHLERQVMVCRQK